MCDEGLREAAKANPEEKFALMFNRVLESLFVERMDQNEDIFARFMGDESFQKTVASWLVGEVYKKFQSQAINDKHHEHQQAAGFSVPDGLLD